MVTDGLEGRVVVGYVRSSAKGDDVHHSVSLQKEVMQQFVAALGGEVSVWYVDEEDGSSMERSALQHLVAAAGSPGRTLDVLVVYSWSRLCRSVEDLNILISLAGNSGVEVVSVSEPHFGPSFTVCAERLMEVFEELQGEVHGEKPRRVIAHDRLMREF